MGLALPSGRGSKFSANDALCALHEFELFEFAEPVVTAKGASMGKFRFGFSFSLGVVFGVTLSESWLWVHA